MGPFVENAHSISKQMTERQAHIAFNLTDRVGSATLARLVGEHGSAAAAWEAYAHKTSRSGGPVDWEREEALAKKYGVTLLTAVDAGYPERLRTAPSAPLVLYVKGDVAALSKPAIALVGTRRATSYGTNVASRLAGDLSAAGWSVVSGLALGIDAAAHRGALDAGGVTVGVIGSGLDRFYPEENRDLAREMVAKGGAVVSEFPFGRPADQTTFPIRNHVVAALATGVVAVECPARSGTLITTSIAADLGRTVMAVPSRIDSRMSAGCLSLIREGATLVRNADDVLEAVNGLIPACHESRVADRTARTPDPQAPSYSVEEALVMTNVDDEGVSVDELVRRTKLPVEKVNSLVMSLRIKGFIKFLPGNRISPLTRHP